MALVSPKRAEMEPLEAICDADLEQLPHLTQDIWELILSKFPTKELIKELSLVCHQWHDMVSQISSETFCFSMKPLDNSQARVYPLPTNSIFPPGLKASAQLIADQEEKEKARAKVRQDLDDEAAADEEDANGDEDEAEADEEMDEEENADGKPTKPTTPVAEKKAETQLAEPAAIPKWQILCNMATLKVLAVHLPERVNRQLRERFFDAIKACRQLVILDFKMNCEVYYEEEDDDDDDAQQLTALKVKDISTSLKVLRMRLTNGQQGCKLMEPEKFNDLKFIEHTMGHNSPLTEIFPYDGNLSNLEALRVNVHHTGNFNQAIPKSVIRKLEQLSCLDFNFVSGFGTHSYSHRNDGIQTFLETLKNLPQLHTLKLSGLSALEPDDRPDARLRLDIFSQFLALKKLQLDNAKLSISAVEDLLAVPQIEDLYMELGQFDALTGNGGGIPLPGAFESRQIIEISNIRNLAIHSKALMLIDIYTLFKAPNLQNLSLKAGSFVFDLHSTWTGTPPAPANKDCRVEIESKEEFQGPDWTVLQKAGFRENQLFKSEYFEEYSIQLTLNFEDGQDLLKTTNRADLLLEQPIKAALGNEFEHEGSAFGYAQYWHHLQNSPQLVSQQRDDLY